MTGIENKLLNTDFSRHPLMQKYRLFREGIICLPHLEAHLFGELERLSEVHVPVSNAPVERAYVVNSLRTIRERVRTTYRALAGIQRGIKKSTTEAEVEKAAAALLRDDPNAKDILLRLKVAGGPNNLLSSLLQSLRPRYDLYSRCIVTAETYFGAGRREALSEMALSVEQGLVSPSNGQPPTTIAFSICWNPLSCLIVAVVVISVLVATEGTADGGDDGEGDVGDFPEPDPDGGQPA